MVKSYIIITFLVVLNSRLKAQDTTITYSKAEFEKFKYVKAALKNFPKACNIQSYEMIAYMVNGVKKYNYSVNNKPEAYPELFFDHVAKNGGEIIIDKIKTNCLASSHKTKYKIVVN